MTNIAELKTHSLNELTVETEAFTARQVGNLITFR